ncbi:hypothetical protein V1281_002629 [Nitrobacteraceae bacterium AZCC 2161]
MTLATKATSTMTPAQRQGHNLALALELAANGYYVFPSNNKVPLCAVWQKADTSFTPAAREAEVVKANEKNGFMPLHVGSTIDAKVIKKLWKKYPDAVPSLSCGPSNLFVIDADVNDGTDGKRVKAGPAKLSAWLTENDVPMEGVFIVKTRSGGRHVYFKNNELLGSAAGTLRDLDCDLRGQGGQTVAPGAVRVDGASYDIMGGMTLADLANTPETPAGIVTAARTQREMTTVSEADVASRIATLQEATIAPFGEVFDPIMGYDLDKLAKKDSEFADLRANGTGDFSDIRFKMTRCLMREWPQMPIEHLLSFMDAWTLDSGEPGAGTFHEGSQGKKGAGEYNFRDISREHKKGPSEHKITDGVSMGAAYDEDDNELSDDPKAVADREIAKAQRKVEADNEKLAKKEVRLASRGLYIEDIAEGEIDDQDWAVEDIVVRNTVSVMVGMWGTGKTAVSLDMGLHQSLGLPWHDKETKHGVVIYVALENATDVERRVRAWRQRDERENIDTSKLAFYLWKSSCALVSKDGRPTVDELDLIEIAKRASEHYGLPINQIIIDTVAKSIGSGDENDAGDAGRYMQGMQRVAEATGANVMALHHPPKNGTDPRGSGAFSADGDTVLNVTRKDNGICELRAGGKFRVGDPSLVKIDYRLVAETVGHTIKGKPINVVLAERVGSRASPATGMDVSDQEGDAVRFRVADDSKGNEKAVLDIISAFAVETLMPEERLTDIAVIQKSVLIAWNKWRSERDDLSGAPLKPCDRTQLDRVIGRLVEAGSVVRIEGGRQAKIRLK